MAVWADFDEGDEPSKLVHTQVTASRSRNHDVEDEAVQNNSCGNAGNNPSAYIAHALRCYPYAQRGCILELTY